MNLSNLSNNYLYFWRWCVCKLIFMTTLMELSNCIQTWGSIFFFNVAFDFLEFCLLFGWDHQKATFWNIRVVNLYFRKKRDIITFHHLVIVMKFADIFSGVIMKNNEGKKVYVYFAIQHEFPYLIYSSELIWIVKIWSKVVFSLQMNIFGQKNIRKVLGILLSLM